MKRLENKKETEQPFNQKNIDMTFKAETPKNYEEKIFETVDPKMSRNIERVSSFEKY